MHRQFHLTCLPRSHGRPTQFLYGLLNQPRQRLSSRGQSTFLDNLRLVKQPPNFRFIDLFAGIGGFHHALAALRGECVLTCELDDHCRRVYRHSFPGHPPERYVDNIRSLTRHRIDDENSLRTADEIRALVPEHDVLCGGFPCQPFSKSGAQQGVRDRTRGTLFFDIVQIIQARMPRFVLLENVRNIAGPRHKDTWATVIDTLRGLGYAVGEEPMVFSPHFLPPTLGGAPQVRDRVFIIAVRKDGPIERLALIAAYCKQLRAKSLWNPSKWRISDLLIDDAQLHELSRLELSADEESYLKAWNYFVENMPSEDLPGFPIWSFAFTEQPTLDDSMPVWEKTFRSKNSAFYNEFRPFLDAFMDMKWGPKQRRVSEFPYSRQILEWQARSWHPTRQGRTLRDLVVQYRPSGIRAKPPTYLPALVAITQTSIVGPALRKHANKFRRLSVVEAARLQGIPDSVCETPVVEDRHAYKQLGNAVNVGIVRFVCQIMLGLGEQHEAIAAPESAQMEI
jgi:DNA (cytosine-5)-methyltransferase 1